MKTKQIISNIISYMWVIALFTMFTSVFTGGITFDSIDLRIVCIVGSFWGIIWMPMLGMKD